MGRLGVGGPACTRRYHKCGGGLRAKPQKFKSSPPGRWILPQVRGRVGLEPLSRNGSKALTSTRCPPVRSLHPDTGCPEARQGVDTSGPGGDLSRQDLTRPIPAGYSGPGAQPSGGLPPGSGLGQRPPQDGPPPHWFPHRSGACGLARGTPLAPGKNPACAAPQGSQWVALRMLQNWPPEDRRHPNWG